MMSWLNSCAKTTFQSWKAGSSAALSCGWSAKTPNSKLQTPERYELQEETGAGHGMLHYSRKQQGVTPITMMMTGQTYGPNHRPALGKFRASSVVPKLQFKLTETKLSE